MEGRSELQPVAAGTMERALILADWFYTQTQQVLKVICGTENRLESLVLSVAVDLFRQYGEGPHPTTLITECVNRGVPPKNRLKPHQVGHGCGRLGFERRHGEHGNAWLITAEKLKKLIGYVPEHPPTAA